MADFEQQRLNMVESQIRPSNITDRRIMRAMARLPREQFLPEGNRALAYHDGPLTLATDAYEQQRRVELAPRDLARLIHEAKITEADTVLDVGSASGYSSAILASLCDTVIGLEIREDLATRAGETLSALAIDNAAIVSGPLTEGYNKSGPYDVIVMEGAVAEVPDKLIAQLKEGGRLVGILANREIGQACCWRRVGDSVSRRICFDAHAPVLPGFEREDAFSF